MCICCKTTNALMIFSIRIISNKFNRVRYRNVSIQHMRQRVFAYYNNITKYHRQFKFFFFKYFPKLTMRLFTTHLHLFSLRELIYNTLQRRYYICRIRVHKPGGCKLVGSYAAAAARGSRSSDYLTPGAHFPLIVVSADRTRRVCQSSIL